MNQLGFHWNCLRIMSNLLLKYWEQVEKPLILLPRNVKTILFCCCSLFPLFILENLHLPITFEFDLEPDPREHLTIVFDKQWFSQPLNFSFHICKMRLIISLKQLLRILDGSLKKYTVGPLAHTFKHFLCWCYRTWLVFLIIQQST